MHSQIVTIARMQGLTPNDSEPSIYMNKAVIEAFKLSDKVLGSIASFSIEGFLFRVRVAAFLDESNECTMYFSNAALRLLRIKENSSYLVTYHSNRRCFAFGYRKNIKQASFAADDGERSVSLLDWYEPEKTPAPVGLRLRVLAMTLDLAILGLCLGEIYTTFSYISTLIIGLLIIWLYFALLESSWMQATIGKYVFGMRVTDIYQRRISFVTASGRFVARIVTPVALIRNLIVRRHETMHVFHDLVTGCAVVKRQR